MNDSQLIVIVQKKTALNLTISKEISEDDKYKIILNLVNLINRYDTNKVNVYIPSNNFEITYRWLESVGFCYIKTERNIYNGDKIDCFEINSNKIIGYYTKEYILKSKL